jgi:tetratricopeptide (TPR) repeat protein
MVLSVHYWKLRIRMVAGDQNTNETRAWRSCVRWRPGIAAALFLFAAGACLGSYSYRQTFDTQGNPLGALLPEFSPAVLFASGHGMIIPEDLEVPALEAFLSLDAATFDPVSLPQEIPGSHLFFSDQSSFAQSHWLLFYSMGWCWRIFGISHASLQYLCALFYGFAAVALYFVFRLGMGRMTSVAGALMVLLLPPFLGVAPLLRDFSKAPFILLFIALAGNVLKQRGTGRTLLQYSMLLGVVVGIGYGFRQDMLICVPVLLATLLFAPLHGNWRFLYRVSALALAVGIFVLTALPSLTGVRSDSGSVSTHTLFQGLSRQAEQEMGFGDAPYDLLLHPFDTEVHAVVNAHARMRGVTGPMDFYLSPLYGSSGRHLFFEWARTFPADLYARGLASIETTARLSSLATEYHAYEPFAGSALGRKLEPWHGWYHRWIERYGLLFILAALFVVAMKSICLALGMLLLMGWFMAYPNLLFEVRHAFHLSFVTLWALLFLIDNGVHSIVCCSGISSLKERQSELIRTAKVVCGVFLGLGIGAFALLLVLRGVQGSNVSQLAGRYQDAILDPVDTVVEAADYRTLVKPLQKLPGLRESWNLRLGDVAAEYLMLEFAPVAYPIPMTVRYQSGRGPDFTRQIIVPASGHTDAPTYYYFPVYEMANYMPVEFALIKHRFSNTPLANLLVHHLGTNRFMGIELFADDVPLLKGMYRVTDREKIPWLLYLHAQPGNGIEPGHKKMRIEKELKAVPVELRLWIKGDVEAAALAYLDLLNRFPGQESFVHRATALIAAVADVEKRADMLCRLARSIPSLAGEIARQLAAMGDDYRQQKHFEQAEAKYMQALMLSPQDRGYQVKLADSLLAREEFDQALNHYRAILMVAPESPYSAAQFDNICAKLDKMSELSQFWEALHEKYPEAAVPALRLARDFERHGRLAEALELYTRVEMLHPDNGEAILRRGIAVAIMEGYAKGRVMMDKALELAPELRPELVAGLTRIATHYTETGAHSFAEAIYREVMELAPDDGWHKVRYGEALLAQENYVKAGEVFVSILERAPESPYSAHKLNEVFQKRAVPNERIAFWESLCKQHPDAYIPALQYAIALEDMGEYDKALAQLRALHKAHPEQQEALLRLGMLTARMGDYEEGRTMMEAAVKSDASLASLYTALLTQLAEYFLENKDADRASTLFAALLEANATNDFLKTRLAESLILQQRYEDALIHCRELMLKTPENSYIADLIDSIYVEDTLGFKRAMTWQSLCAVLPESVLPLLRYGAALEAQEGGWKVARDVYSQALGHAPENTTLQLRYGILTALLDGYEKGRAVMDEAIQKSPELSPEMASGLVRIAVKASGENRYEQAESLYREAIAFAPEDYAYHLHLAAFLLKQERWEDARDLLCIILNANPESPLSARLLDNTYEKDNNNKKRLEMWREIVKANPEAQVPLYHLGLAYEACDMQQEALDTYKKILELNSEHTEAQEAIKRVEEKPL